MKKSWPTRLPSRLTGENQAKRSIRGVTPETLDSAPIRGWLMRPSTTVILVTGRP
jgi:hypothetical protein